MAPNENPPAEPRSVAEAERGPKDGAVEAPKKPSADCCG